MNTNKFIVQVVLVNNFCDLGHNTNKGSFLCVNNHCTNKCNFFVSVTSGANVTVFDDQTFRECLHCIKKNLDAKYGTGWRLKPLTIKGLPS